MLQRFMLSAVAFLFSAVLASAQDAPTTSTSLAPTLRAGDALSYMWTEETFQRTAPIETPDGGQVREGALTADADFKVISADESGFTLEMKLTRIVVTAKAGERTASYDSANPGPEPEPVNGQKMERAFESSIKPLIDRTLTLKLSPRGVINECSGAADLMEMTKPTSRFALLLMSVEALNAKFGGAFTTWSQTDASLTWNSTQQVPYVPGIIFEVAYEHTATQTDGLITVEAKGTPSIKVPNPKRLGTRELRTHDVKFSQVWNPASGRGEQASFTQNCEVLLKAPEEGAGKQAIVTNRLKGELRVRQ